MIVGVVGYGSIGQRHASNASLLGHKVLVYDPVTRCDVKFERQIYDTCDAVVIATPTWVHIAGIRACAERGRHMLIEKPIAKTMATLREMLDFAASKNLTVMMGNNLRFHPSIRRAKQYVDSGMLGQLRWANFICATEWTSTAARDGVVLNTGSHEVDIALYLFGPAVVLTATASHDVSADFVLQHDIGVRSTFHIDIDTTARVRQFWIAGAEKSYQFDLDVRTSYSHQDKGTYLGGTYADDYLAEMRAFFDRIEGKDVPGATGEDGFATLDVLIEVRKMAGLE